LTVCCTKLVTSKVTVDPAVRPTFTSAQRSATSPPEFDHDRPLR
jgi:hypothetical protein